MAGSPVRTMTHVSDEKIKLERCLDIATALAYRHLGNDTDPGHVTCFDESGRFTREWQRYRGILGLASGYERLGCVVERASWRWKGFVPIQPLYATLCATDEVYIVARAVQNAFGSDAGYDAWVRVDVPRRLCDERYYDSGCTLHFSKTKVMVFERDESDLCTICVERPLKSENDSESVWLVCEAVHNSLAACSPVARLATERLFIELTEAAVRYDVDSPKSDLN
ncbi:hypothetical protein EVAR_18384_1 [Eumeta japonica]|uniref:Uncharacterized protein n=1 Tax=Eumeta variegata TaxID=151549 RepID=A0A4C1UVT4_EUMVA|nr:hypothetical protein EVAR_18384_1 [Eumeta japonica]